MRALSVVVEAACRPLRIKPPIYPRRVEFFAHDYAFDISKAERRLGYSPKVDMDEGIDRTIAAYRDEGAAGLKEFSVRRTADARASATDGQGGNVGWR